ncbi:hypothetical protein F4556_001370 [Kitasatospora gansuensis]|uniref:DUF2809 domain-containing protein n=1 Tax=Kitasatospora gansuensis TaxID=258050 RepID=A0A7W7S8K4_9ACTN|nr:DUF2809 domain-containing protein [Kitasatospora gansuensis]MBB4945835.1 hypothetical protein [Kitasatospora gansuensis]
MRFRILLLIAGTVAAGLGLLAVVDGAVADVFRDALYTTVLYLLVLLAAPRARPTAAAGIALGLSFAVEFLQLTRIPPALRLVLGSTFNPPDLLWYAVGAAACLLIHRRLRRPGTGSG